MICFIYVLLNKKNVFLKKICIVIRTANTPYVVISIQKMLLNFIQDVYFSAVE